MTKHDIAEGYDPAALRAEGEVRAERLRELEEMAAKLLATASELPPGPNRHDALQLIGKFRLRIDSLRRIGLRSAQRGPKAKGKEPVPKPDCRSIADAMADNAASLVLLAPPEQRDGAIASCTEGFRDACIEYGISVEPGDLAYYVKIVSAKVAEMGTGSV